MGNFFFKFFIIIFSIIFSIIIFLSYFGIETDKFDSIIKNETNEINQYIKLDFKKTKIHINLIELNLIVKLKNPKVLIKNDEILLSKLDLFFPLKSFFTTDFLLKKANISFAKNDIKDLTKVTNIFLPRFVNKKLKKIFHTGSLEGDFLIPFESNGTIGKDYVFSGKISNAEINLNKEFSIKKLTTEIKHTKKGNNDIFNIKLEHGRILNIQLAGSEININREDKKTKIITSIQTKGDLDFTKVKNVAKLFSLNINFFENLKGDINLKTKINFDLTKKLKIKNLFYSTEGDISYLEIITKENNIIKKYLPDFDSKIVLKDNKFKFIKSKKNNTAELIGSIKAKKTLINLK